MQGSCRLLPMTSSEAQAEALAAYRQALEDYVASKITDATLEDLEHALYVLGFEAEDIDAVV